MNIKAERIENIIQVVNRNLALAMSGQSDGVTPLELRHLQKVDTVIFGHDKFAFEMVHFVKSAADKETSELNISNTAANSDQKVAEVWESSFVKGLESLLVECAVVNDDIERDCFVSRVYCWFTEKLGERRELPRRAPRLEQLRSSINRLEGTYTHTLKGLDGYDPENNLEATIRAENERVNLAPEHAVEEPLPNDHDLPVIQLPARQKEGKFGNRKIPQYVKQGFPEVLKSSTAPLDLQHAGLFPKIPGAEESYGMVYNKLETEAERTMHELWMARRRQEAFEFKTQQHLALVMDRIALHKSRLESDALRRQESGQLLKAREAAANSQTAVGFAATNKSNNQYDSAKATPRAPSSRQGDVNSGAVNFEGSARMLRHVDASPSPNSRSRRRSPNRRSAATDASSPDPHQSHLIEKTSVIESKGAHTAHRLEDRHLTHIDAADTNLTVSDKGLMTPTSIPRAARSSVQRGSVSSFRPMKFKMDLPESYPSDHMFYMQQSDSDDDDKPERVPASAAARRGHHGAATGPTPAANAAAVGTTGGKAAATGAGPPKKKAGGAAGGKVDVKFKHEAPVIRERPVSARMFHSVAANDPEFKVHYRHTNYRRMPMTEEQERWLEEQETRRHKKSEETAKALLEAALAKADKKKGKGGKDAKKDKKDKGKKDEKNKSAKKDSGKAGAAAEERPKPKYKSATQFMEINFPNFEGDDDAEAVGPMRATQLIEVQQILECCDDDDIQIKESTLRKALVVPQDKPEAICLEGLREEKEGLMLNPLPRELWRKFVMKKAGGKKGKRRRK